MTQARFKVTEVIILYYYDISTSYYCSTTVVQTTEYSGTSYYLE